MVGPGGLFIVDTKAWSEVTIAEGRIYRGDADVTEEMDALADLRLRTEEDPSKSVSPPARSTRSPCSPAGRASTNASGRVRIVGEKDALRAIASHGNRLTPAQVDVALGRALAFFPQIARPRR